MHDSPRPTAIVRADGVLVSEFLDGAMVYDPSREVGHRIGPLAALLLSCDEPAEIDDLLEMAGEAMDMPMESCRALIGEAVSSLTQIGLITLVGDDGPPDPSPREQSPTTEGISDQTPPMIDAGWTVGITHAIHDHRVAFCGPDSDLIDRADRYLGNHCGPDEPTTFFELTPSADRTGHIDLVTHTTWSFADMDRLLWQLPTVMNEFARFAARVPVLHSGGVRTPDGSVLLMTGAINAGKSTITAALVRAGCDYLGDESIGIRSHRDTFSAVAYPKPLSLDQGSQLLVGIDPPVDACTPADNRRAAEIRADAQSLVGDIGPITAVFETAFRPDAEINVERLEKSDAIKVIMANSLNLTRSGSAGLGALCGLAESVPVLRLNHGDAISAADWLLRRSTSGTAAANRSTSRPSIR